MLIEYLFLSLGLCANVHTNWRWLYLRMYRTILSEELSLPHHSPTSPLAAARLDSRHPRQQNSGATIQLSAPLLFILPVHASIRPSPCRPKGRGGDHGRVEGHGDDGQGGHPQKGGGPLRAGRYPLGNGLRRGSRQSGADLRLLCE